MKTINDVTESNLTEQEIFDQVATHLLKQNCKSISECGETCRYRTIDHEQVLKCAAGCLVPDDEYHLVAERFSVSNQQYFKKKFPQQLGIITELQTIHDVSELEEWKDDLIELAADWNLTCNFT